MIEAGPEYCWQPGSEIPSIEDIQRAGQPAGCFQKHPAAQAVAQRQGIDWLEHAYPVAQAQAIGNPPAGHHAGAATATFSFQQEIPDPQLARDIAGDARTASQSQPQSGLTPPGAVARCVVP